MTDPHASNQTDLPYPRVEARVLPGWVEEAEAFQAATLFEAAGKRGALPPAIKPLAMEWEVCGPAVTVKAAPRDNLWIHRALAIAEPGDVLVVDASGHYDAGYWGEVMNVSAVARKLGGLVINGCVRDGRQLVASGFPVFARGLCLIGTAKNPEALGFANQPLVLGEALVHPGDLIRGDCDGVVALPRVDVPEILERARVREEKEAASMNRLRQGETTLALRGWK